MTIVRVGVQAASTSTGQSIDFDDGPLATSIAMTNVGAEAVQYSTNGGSSFTSIAAGASALVGQVTSDQFRMRRATAGGYPVPVDVDVTAQDGLTRSQVAAVAASAFANTYTWATLPAASAYIGTAYVTDVGLSGSLWRSDGANWGVVGGSVVLGRTNVAGTALTGSTTETIDWVYTIPAGLLGANGALELQAKYTMTNNANNKNFRVRLGAVGSGISGTALMDPQLASVAASHVNCRIENRNSQASQIGSNNAASMYGGSANTFRTGTVNTAVAADLTLTSQLVNSADSITFEGARLILIRP